MRVVKETELRLSKPRRSQSESLSQSQAVLLTDGMPTDRCQRFAIERRSLGLENRATWRATFRPSWLGHSATTWLLVQVQQERQAQQVRLALGLLVWLGPRRLVLVDWMVQVERLFHNRPNR